MSAERQHDEKQESVAKVLRFPPVINYRPSVPRILTWSDAVVDAWQRGNLSDGDLRDFLVLRRYARDTGALCLSKGNEPHGWWTEEQLGSFIRVTRKTFRARWDRWQAAGWVESSKPANPKHPLQRWLGKVRVDG